MARPLRLTWIALILAVAGGLFFMLNPYGYSGESESFDTATGHTTSTRTHSSALEVNGLASMWVLLIPVVLIAIPLALPRRLLHVTLPVCTVALGGLTMLGMASVGMFITPALIVMIVAAVTARDSAAGP